MCGLTGTWSPVKFGFFAVAGFADTAGFGLTGDSLAAPIFDDSERCVPAFMDTAAEELAE